MALHGSANLHTVFTSECNNHQFDWFTVGVYQTASQAFGLGLGAFGLPVEKAVPGGVAEAQVHTAHCGCAPLARRGPDHVIWRCGRALLARFAT